MTTPLQFSKNPHTNVVVKLALSILLSIIIAAISTLGLRIWLDSTWMQWTGTHDIPTTVTSYTPRDIAGLMAFTFGAPIAFFLFMNSLITMIRYLGYNNRKKSNVIVKSFGLTALLLLTIAATFGMMYFSYDYGYQVLQCQIFWCYNSETHTWPVTSGDFGDAQEGFKATLAIPAIALGFGVIVTAVFLLLRDYTTCCRGLLCGGDLKYNDYHYNKSLRKKKHAPSSTPTTSVDFLSSINDPLLSSADGEVQQQTYLFSSPSAIYTNLPSNNPSFATENRNGQQDHNLDPKDDERIYAFSPYNTYFHPSLPLPQNHAQNANHIATPNFTSFYSVVEDSMSPRARNDNADGANNGAQHNTTTTTKNPNTTSYCTLRHAQYLLFALSLTALFSAIWISGAIAPNNFRNLYPSIIAQGLQRPLGQGGVECVEKYNFNCPEVPDARFTTTEYILDEKYIRLKLFPSNGIYFDSLFVLGLGGVLLSLLPFVHGFLSKKIAIKLYPMCLLCSSRGGSTPQRKSDNTNNNNNNNNANNESNNNSDNENKNQPSHYNKNVTGNGTFTTYWTLYELLFLITATICGYLFFSYWHNSHNWKNKWPGSDRQTTWDSLMRAVGQLGVFVFAMLLFPIARNSVVLSIMGISYESSLTYHKLFGTLFLVVALAHVGAALFVYCEVTTLAGALRDLFWPFPVRSFENWDNFTIPIATYVTLISLFTIGFASLYEPFRRYNYQLFLALHHMTYPAMILSLLWHANSSWIYILPPLTIYIVDRFARLFKMSKSVELYPTLLGDAQIAPHNAADQDNGQMAGVATNTAESFEVYSQYSANQPTSLSLTLNTRQTNLFVPQHNTHIALPAPGPIQTTTMAGLSQKLFVAPQNINPNQHNNGIQKRHTPRQPEATPQEYFYTQRAHPPGVRLLDYGASGKIVELTVDNSQGKFVHCPGQYFFMNIAEISLLESHPVTPSSAVHYTCSEYLTFLIKTTSDENNTWTSRLYKYIEDFITTQRKALLTTAGSEEEYVDDDTILLDIPLTISLDGPVGKEINFTQIVNTTTNEQAFEHIILIGGGIGITPCKAIYESLLLSFIYDYVPALGQQQQQQQKANNNNKYDYQPPTAREAYQSNILSSLYNSEFRNFHNASAASASLVSYASQDDDDMNNSIIGSGLSSHQHSFMIHEASDVGSTTPYEVITTEGVPPAEAIGENGTKNNNNNNNSTPKTSEVADKIKAKSSTNIKNIHLFFAAKDLAMYSVMQDSLKVTPIGPFSAHLYCTNKQQMAVYGNAQGMGLSAAGMSGEAMMMRPDVGGGGFVDDLYYLQQRTNNPLFQNISHLLTFSGQHEKKDGSKNTTYLEEHVLNVIKQLYDPSQPIRINPKKVLLFVCGPENLEQQARYIAHKYGFECHAETFTF